MDFKLASHDAKVGIALMEAMKMPVYDIQTLRSRLKEFGVDFEDVILEEALQLREQVDAGVTLSVSALILDWFLKVITLKRVFYLFIAVCVFTALLLGVPTLYRSFSVERTAVKFSKLSEETTWMSDKLALLSWSVVGDLPEWVQPRIDALYHGEYVSKLREARESITTADDLLANWLPFQDNINVGTVSDVTTTLRHVEGLLERASGLKVAAEEILAEANGLIKMSRSVEDNLLALQTAPERLQASAAEEKVQLLKALETDQDPERHVTRIEGLAKTARLIEDFYGQLSALKRDILAEAKVPVPELTNISQMAKDSFDQGEYTRALELLSRLQGIQKELIREFVIQPIKVNGSYLMTKDENQYLFVRANSPSGAVRVRVQDAQTGTQVETDIWAEKISPAFASVVNVLLMDETPDRLAALIFAEKKAGYFKHNYLLGPKASGLLASDAGIITEVQK